MTPYAEVSDGEGGGGGGGEGGVYYGQKNVTRACMVHVTAIDTQSI